MNTLNIDKDLKAFFKENMPESARHYYNIGLLTIREVIRITLENELEKIRKEQEHEESLLCNSLQ